MNQIIELVAGVLGISPEQITPSTRIDSLPTWDSFNFLLIISALESNFKVKFSIEEIRELVNIDSIRQTLIKHGIPTDKV